MRPQATGHRPQVASHVFTIDELRAFGEGFGSNLAPPAVIALEGELGTGKTTLAQAIARGVGIREDVTSPTFSLVNEYEVDGTRVYHLDLYRLSGPQDLTNIGWDEILNSGEIVVIEWPERAGIHLPDDTMRFRLEYIPGDDNHRRLTIG